MEVFFSTPAIDKILRIADLAYQQNIKADQIKNQELLKLIEDVSEFLLIEESEKLIVFCVIFKLVLTCEENQVDKIKEYFNQEPANTNEVLSLVSNLIFKGIITKNDNEFIVAKNNFQLNFLYAQRIFNERIGYVEMEDLDRLSTMAKIMRVNELTYKKPIPGPPYTNKELEKLVNDLMLFFRLKSHKMTIVFCAIIKYAHTSYYDQMSEVFMHFDGRDSNSVNYYNNHLALKGYVSWAKGEERVERFPFVLDKILIQHILNNSPLSADDLQMIIERGNIYSVFDDDGVYYPDNINIPEDETEERMDEYWEITKSLGDGVFNTEDFTESKRKFIQDFFEENVTNTAHYTIHFDRLLKKEYIDEKIDNFLKQKKAEIGKCITLNEYGHILVYDKENQLRYLLIPSRDVFDKLRAQLY